MLILLGLSLAVIYCKPLSPKKVAFAIDCGAPSTYRGTSGITYEKDVQSEGDTIVADYNLNSEVSSQVIKYTREPDIYLTERHAYKTFSYEIPLQKEGTYVLILKFAEMYFDQKGKRVFNIKFGDRRIIENLDVVAKVGRYAAHDEYIEFEYIAGQAFQNATLCVDAVKNGKLQVVLEKTKLDNPYVHGIILYTGSLNQTDYKDYLNLKENWEKIQKEEKLKQESEIMKKQEAKTKRKERVKMRNDNLNELENEFELTEDIKVQPSPRLSLKSLIVSPVGTAALWVSFSIGLLILKKLFVAIDKYTPTDDVDEQPEFVYKSKKTADEQDEQGKKPKQKKK